MPTGLTSATRTTTKSAICRYPSNIRGSPHAAARRRGRRRPRRRRRRRRCRRRSYPVDQANEPVEDGEHGDRDGDRKHVGEGTATAREDVCEEEHTSIVRPTPSRPHEVRGAPHTDPVKVPSAVPYPSYTGHKEQRK